MSQEQNNNPKLAAQKEALGLYLDSLLGVSVDETLETIAEEKILIEPEVVPLLSDPKIASENSETSLYSGSLSSKYLQVKDQPAETFQTTAKIESPEKIKAVPTVENVRKVEKVAEDIANADNVMSSLTGSILQKSESPIKKGNGTLASHEVYRKKLQSRQKHSVLNKSVLNKQVNAQQAMSKPNTKANKISLASIGKDGKEEKQMLIPRSQFLKQQGKTNSVVEQSSPVVKAQGENLSQQNLSKNTSFDELASDATPDTTPDTTIGSEHAQVQAQAQTKGAIEEKPNTAPEPTKLEPDNNFSNGSISAFEAFAERNKKVQEPADISENHANGAEYDEPAPFNLGTTVNNKTENQKNISSGDKKQSATNTESLAQPQAKKEQQKQQLLDAPNLELSLFLPKVPSLEEIEAIEQKEKLLLAEQFSPDLGVEINPKVAEQPSIQLGVGLSTMPVSPHIQRAKKLAPDWAEPSFQAVFFDVAGLKLAIPLLELNGIVEWGKDYITAMPGHAKWYLGLLQFRGRSVPVIDTLQQVFPPNQVTRLMKDRAEFSNIIMIDDGNWGLACENIIGIKTIAADAVKWRTDQTKRRWLLGTVKEQMCALLDSNEFASMLKTGEDSLVK